jgi:hypothetical protein
MAQSIAITIALEGGAEIQRQLADIGEAGQKAFEQISKSAEQAGGFKNLDTDTVTEKLKQFGVTGADSIKKIQDAVKSAGRLETVVAGVQALETGFVAVAKAAGVVAVGVLAAGAALTKFALGAADTAEAVAKLGNASGDSAANLSRLVLTFASFGASGKEAAAAIESFNAKLSAASRTAVVDAEQSAQRVAQAQQKQADLALKSGNLVIQQAELNAQRNKLLYNQDLTAREQHDLQLRKLGQQQAELNQRQADLARERAKAQEDELNASANDLTRLGTVIAGTGPIVLDARTNFANFVKAVQQDAAQFGTVEERLNRTAAIIDRIADPALKADLVKALGLDKLVPALKEGESLLTVLTQRQQQLQQAGLELSQRQQDNLIDLSRAWNRLTTDIGAALTKIAAEIAPVITAVLNAVAHEIEALSHDIQAIGEEFSHIAQGLGALFGAIGEAATTAAQAVIDAFKTVTEPIVAAFNAILDPVKGVIDTIVSYINTALQAVNSLLQQLGLAASSASGIRPQADVSGGNGGDSGLPFASGGLIGGRGTGTSDSNLAWVSRGEHIMPARAVAQPGVLAFLEALRRSGGNLNGLLDGMGRFARGGLVLPSFASGGLAPATVGARRVLHLNIEGRSFAGLSIPESTAQSLERFAVHSQIASTGRKPSWRR